MNYQNNLPPQEHEFRVGLTKDTWFTGKHIVGLVLSLASFIAGILYFMFSTMIGLATFGLGCVLWLALPIFVTTQVS
jgi:hypothetical protein